MAQIDNCDKIIDSRDIIKRIEELQDERDSLQQAFDDAEEAVSSHDDSCMSDIEELKADVETARKDLEEWDESDEAEELASLEAFAEEASQYSSDWEHGETLINESYWAEYIKEFLSDIGAMPSKIPSFIEIDWDETAANVEKEFDFTQVDFDGTTFYMRNS